jgi:hypothetical protein
MMSQTLKEEGERRTCLQRVQNPVLGFISCFRRSIRAASCVHSRGCLVSQAKRMLPRLEEGAAIRLSTHL